MANGLFASPEDAAAPNAEDEVVDAAEAPNDGGAVVPPPPPNVKVEPPFALIEVDPAVCKPLPSLFGAPNA